MLLCTSRKKGFVRSALQKVIPEDRVSRLAGVVMRKDLRIDGFGFSTVTVGGMDATYFYSRYGARILNRRDINVIMLSGCVIAWFNIINPALIAQETGIP